MSGVAFPNTQAMFYEQYEAVRRDEVVGILLALFLGTFGAHHFYLRRTGLGILYLCFFWSGIPAILGFIECFFMPGRVREFNAIQAARHRRHARHAMCLPEWGWPAGVAGKTSTPRLPRLRRLWWPAPRFRCRGRCSRAATARRPTWLLRGSAQHAGQCVVGDYRGGGFLISVAKSGFFAAAQNDKFVVGWRDLRSGFFACGLRWDERRRTFLIRARSTRSDKEEGTP